ncbi:MULTISPECIES: hypothetical protein [Bacillales]|uniref:hypothetical protein n=1 Tax=Bacillales TaxID=1385 RepID=UPI001EF0F54E|nr:MULTISPECIES: hypothetical protein [Bacillales]
MAQATSLVPLVSGYEGYVREGNSSNRYEVAGITNAFLQQKVTDTFVNDQGVMVGNGEIWLGQFSDRFVVFAINVE